MLIVIIIPCKKSRATVATPLHKSSVPLVTWRVPRKVVFLSLSIRKTTRIVLTHPGWFPSEKGWFCWSYRLFHTKKESIHPNRSFLLYYIIYFNTFSINSFLVETSSLENTLDVWVLTALFLCSSYLSRLVVVPPLYL